MDLETLDLNLDAVAAAIRDVGPYPHLPDYDYDAISLCVAKAIANYAFPDAERYRIVAVEEKFVMDAGADRTVSGIVDLVLENAVGRMYIVDWKFRNADTPLYGPQAATMHTDSWQGKIYAEWLLKNEAQTEFPVVLYRSVTRTGMFKEAPVEIGPETVVSVSAQLDSVFGSMDHLNGPYIVWPRNRPSACHAYGRPCPHLAICQSENNADYWREGRLDTNRLSHSDMSTFMLCNERWRLGEIRGRDCEDVNEDQLMGLAFHRGMAEVYRQLMVWQKGVSAEEARA